jgi:hypothetical protein
MGCFFILTCLLCQDMLLLLILSLAAWAFARAQQLLEGIMMAWDVAAYGITAAVLMIAAACVIGIVKICRSLTRLDLTVERLSRETEASLIQCRKLAEETKEAIVISRRSLQGFSTLAEGAGALGEAAQIAAQTAAHAVAFCRERLASFIPSAQRHRDQTISEQPELAEIGRSPNADPSQGE